MRTLMAAAAAAALLVAGTALADTTATPEPGQPQLAQPQHAQQQKPAVHKAVAHRDRDPVGDRETAALNSLEASGYLKVKDLTPDGKNIAVDAQKPGAGFVHLTVMPDGSIHPAATPAT